MLERAARLFAAKGYDAASMRDLAEEISVRPSSLYHHFSGKDRILFEICYGFQRDFNLKVLPELQADRPPDEAVRTAIRAHILFASHHWPQLLVNTRERRSLPSDQQAAINALRRQYRDALAFVIERGRVAGMFSVPDSKLAAMAILDMVNGLGHWFRPRGRGDLERIAAAYGAAALALLRGWAAGTAESLPAGAETTGLG
jgi:AcrR family transcriptional regulator